MVRPRFSKEFNPNYALEKIKKEKTFTTENTERHGKTTKNLSYSVRSVFSVVIILKSYLSRPKKILMRNPGLIFYTEDNNEIIILRIIHAARDYTRFFDDD